MLIRRPRLAVSPQLLGSDPGSLLSLPPSPGMTFSRMAQWGGGAGCLGFRAGLESWLQITIRGASGVLTELPWTRVSFSLRWRGGGVGSSIGGVCGVAGTEGLAQGPADGN